VADRKSGKDLTAERVADGVDPTVLTRRDLAVFVRHYDDLLRKVKARYPLSGPVAPKDFDAFVQDSAGASRVKWL
jgi:hypothetical protein